jgi:UDP-N-acetylmuramate dehydrogenase
VTEPCLLDSLKGKLLHHHSMEKFTSWRAGGAANSLYIPKDYDDLKFFIKQLPPNESLCFMGLGSNSLVLEGGFDGTIVITQGALMGLEKTSALTVTAGAGVSCAQLARFSAREGLTGLEFLAGIPGTVGGALTMNAGCYGGETWDRVASVELIDRSGAIIARSAKEFSPTYRHVDVPDNHFFVRGVFTCELGDSAHSLKTIKSLLAKRNAQQPTNWPTGGSVFRNPPNDYSARLIESCGLKGYKIGNASVSEKHANFIINEGGATAGDIIALIDHVSQCVYDKTGTRLEREVRIIGEYNDLV